MADEYEFEGGETAAPAEANPLPETAADDYEPVADNETAPEPADAAPEPDLPPPGPTLAEQQQATILEQQATILEQQQHLDALTRDLESCQAQLSQAQQKLATPAFQQVEKLQALLAQNQEELQEAQLVNQALGGSQPAIMQLTQEMNDHRRKAMRLEIDSKSRRKEARSFLIFGV